MKNSSTPSAVACVLRALRKEILDFDFNYPLQTDAAAGPRDSLHYYLYDGGLTWEDSRIDSSGIPRTWSRTTGINYWPADVAWYALAQLGHYVRGKGAQHLDIFLKQVDWLETRALLRNDGAVVWPMHFNYLESGVL